jgi:hypothetical protein
VDLHWSGFRIPTRAFWKDIEDHGAALVAEGGEITQRWPVAIIVSGTIGLTRSH